MTTPRGFTRRLATAVIVAAVIVGAAPAAGVARSRLLALLGPRFSVVLLAVLALIVAATIASALRRTRPFTMARALMLAAAGLIAAVYTWRTGSSDPAIRAVELVHFVEYGAITAAFHRVWRDRGGAAALVLPGLAAFLAGLAEEAYQWFLPARVGELRDVLLNGVAIGCALLATRALTGPPPPAATTAPPATASITRLLAVVVLALAAFVHLVHLGVRVDEGGSAFESRYDAAALADLARDRATTWAAAPPLVRPDRLSREDQYATEGLQHVQARNTAWTAGDAGTAWHENLILERHFVPVLDTPSYVSRTGHRWDAAQRSDAQARAGESAARPFVSRAFPYPLYRWSPLALWSAAIAVAAALWLAAVRLRP